MLFVFTFLNRKLSTQSAVNRSKFEQGYKRQKQKTQVTQRFDGLHGKNRYELEKLIILKDGSEQYPH